ncbi:MAG TPA: ATPase, T2SS/T4P/T4SS family [Pusillimonas sp.]|uniref:ATPase, T2SS/T4P/T4SS family n=1 Tax=Pusillimonas sp. TaxID=3040095 RepID=UPI002BEC5BE7|nr:ATPase, T2SS/T4P/T4SS family [Pusillimonas sp.]HUH86638.1 ATPase, T2SS/T4P/T4SS family [Pusillimonas sp.]
MRAAWSSWSRLNPPDVVLPIADPSALNISPVSVLESLDDILGVRPAFVRSISRELDVEALAARLCPVLLEDGTVAIFALAEHAGSDQANALVRLVGERGYQPAQPPFYILPAPLLLAIARGQVTPQMLSGAGSRMPSQAGTALADAFQDMLEWGVRVGASDLHINIHLREPESEVRFTLSGRYVAPERFQGIPTRTLMDMLAVIWMDVRGGNGAVFDPGIEQQGSLVKRVEGRQVLLRWASLAAERGPSVCLRLLHRDAVIQIPSLTQLGYLPHQCSVIESAVLAQGGAIVFSGSVGSGKSTSLAALIAGVPADRKVVTLEDPVEYLIPNAVQNTLARALHETAHDEYGSKLRTLKRSAMNDVLLGEIRDLESGRAFVDLAGSGVSVYTSTHAASAALVADRLASDFIGVPRDFLATPGVLKLIVHQALLPLVCPECALCFREATKGPLTPPRTAGSWQVWLGFVQRLYGADAESLRFRNEGGCPTCRQAGGAHLAGYAGRSVAAEYIEPAFDYEWLHCIRQSQSLGYLSKPAVQFPGMHRPESISTALHCAMYKALLGQVDVRDVERVFMPLSLQMRIQGEHHLSVMQVPA